jgi:N-acetylglutamate synthase-like GNAT family acetyltransferase
MTNQPLLVCKIEFGTPEYDEAVRLRYEVLREPLGLDFTAEQLAEEYEDHHLGIYLPQGGLAGCLSFKPVDEHELKMRQVAVAPTLQGKGIGAQLVLAAEQYAKQLGTTRIFMHARLTAVAFYEKLNYTKVGAQFEEVGISHFKLEKEI